MNKDVEKKKRKRTIQRYNKNEIERRVIIERSKILERQT